MTTALDFTSGEPITAPEHPSDNGHTSTPTADAPYGYKADGTAYKRRPNSTGKTRMPSTRKASSVDIKAGMTEMYVSAGVLALMRGDQELALMLLGEKRMTEIRNGVPTGDTSIADAAGSAWAKIAEMNPAFHNAMSKLLNTGVWAEVLSAHLPLIMLTAKRKPKLGMFKRAFIRRAASRRKPASAAPEG